jgi:cell volume regulation protein A
VTIEQLDLALLVGTLVLIAAVAAVRLSTRVGLPTLLLYVALGVLIGEDGFGIEFDDFELTRVLGYAALVIILAEGGLTTSWPNIKAAVPAAVALSTVGVAVSVAVVGAAAHVMLDMDWRTAFLLGAVVSSTDAAAVFSVLRRVPLPPRLGGLLEAESGFNDAPVLLLVVALSSSDGHLGWELPLLIAAELAGGAAIGLAVGRLGAIALRSIALPASGLYPIAVMALAVAAYGAAAVVHASGFMAVFVAGIVLGNASLPHRAATRGFAEGLAWLAQIGLFVLLGLLVNPSHTPAVLLPAVGIGLVLLLVARPLSVVASLAPFGIGWREQVLASWAGLRGAVPIVLATVPIVEDVPGGQRLFDIVFVLVVVFTLIQGPTLPFVASLVGMSPRERLRDLDVESSPLDTLDAALLQLRIPETSRMHGVEVFELRLPKDAAITLIVREDSGGFVPDRHTVLQHGDELLIVTTSSARAATERRLQEVSRRGRLAGWRPDRDDTA